MKPVVAIMAQGAMGAGIARVLTARGLSVLTCLEGRSAASTARAHAAGMQAVGLDELMRADIVMSILPPAEAMPFARRLAPFLKQAARKPLYADCNAVSPARLHAIEAVIADTGAAFADIGIIGLPPSTGATPRLYAAGAELALLESLRDQGLDVRAMTGPPGAASSLKMAYAGINKGLIAAASSMILAASRVGAGAALADELKLSEPLLLASLARRVTDMPPKAYRWVAEMREIGEFAQSEAGSALLYEGAALFYETLAIDEAGPRTKTGVLRAFFQI